jgi:hypothetical protein
LLLSRSRRRRCQRSHDNAESGKKQNAATVGHGAVLLWPA